MNLSKDYQLLAITSPAGILTTELIEEFSDDHIPCAKGKINGIQIDLWYCGSETIGALKYASESDTAKEDVYNALQAEISSTVQSMFDLTDEELIEGIKKDRVAYENALKYLRNAGKDSYAWQEIAGLYEGAGSEVLDHNTMTLMEGV